MKRTIISAMLLFMIFGFSVAQAGAQQDADKAIASAKAALKKVSKVKYAWRDTGKMIEKAEAAAKAKDYKKAQKTAKKAETQSVLAFKQYEMEMLGKKK